MNNIADIVFVYDLATDRCYIQVSQQPFRELTTKGSIERETTIIGTWFQIDEKENHWVSFRKDKFRLDQWEAFYKRVQGEQITYYRRLFYGVERMLTFSFTEKDEWIKDPSSGKWRNKF